MRIGCAPTTRLGRNQSLLRLDPTKERTSIFRSVVVIQLQRNKTICFVDQHSHSDFSFSWQSAFPFKEPKEPRENKVRMPCNTILLTAFDECVKLHLSFA